MPAITTRTVAGLVVAIAATDVFANVVVPENARVPVKLVLLVAFVAWARRSAHLSWDVLGLDPQHLRRGLLFGAIAMLVIGAGIAMLVAIPWSRDYFESSDVASDSTALHWLMPLVIIPLGTALFEETLFRGVLFGALLQTYPQRIAVGVSAVVFGLWHLVPEISAAAGLGEIIGTVAFTTAVGVLFAVIRLWARHLAAPVMTHTATNSFAYVAALIVS